MSLDETPPPPSPEADPEIGRITTNLKENIFYIGIDRPTKLNGFTPEMFRQMAEAFTEYENNRFQVLGIGQVTNNIYNTIYNTINIKINDIFPLIITNKFNDKLAVIYNGYLRDSNMSNTDFILNILIISFPLIGGCQFLI